MEIAWNQTSTAPGKPMARLRTWSAGRKAAVGFVSSNRLTQSSFLTVECLKQQAPYDRSTLIKPESP
jgi:hypothetical protein